MAVIPAGKLINGVPLTGMEAAVLSSVASWAQKNTSWYQTTIALGIGRIVCLALAVVFLLVEPIISMIVVIAFIILHFLMASNQPTPVIIPRIAATHHQTVSVGPTSHLVTTNPHFQTSFYTRGTLQNRQFHNPSHFPTSSPWQQGDGDFYYLSLDSFDGLINMDRKMAQELQSSELFEVPLNLLIGKKAAITAKIINNFSDDHVGEDVSAILQCFDTEAKNNTQQNINWFMDCSQHNLKLLPSLNTSMHSDLAQYESWNAHLLNQGRFYQTMSFDSTEIGWEKAKLGLSAAEKNLEKSVASSIIAQEEAVVREMEQNEAKMREKSADYQLVIAEESERLGRRMIEIDGMISAQNSTVSKLNTIDVPLYLSLESKYAITTGGGGYVGPNGGNVSGVTSSVGSYSYTVPNPAATTVTGLIELASGELIRYQNMKNAIQIEINELSGAFNRRSEQMKAQQEKRLEELDAAKERAIHAIRKDSREVANIALQNNPAHLSPWELVKQRTEEIWQRPNNILSKKYDDYITIATQVERFTEQVKENITNNLKTLTDKSYVNIIPQEAVDHHWVMLNGEPCSEIVQMGIVQFNNMDVVQREQGETHSVLGLNEQELLSHNIHSSKITECLMFLFRNGAIDSKVLKSISKCKNPQFLKLEVIS